MRACDLRATVLVAATAALGLGGCAFAQPGQASTARIVDGEREDHRCGPKAGGEPCGPGRCCSVHGWCGSADEPACGREHGYNGAYDGRSAPVARAAPAHAPVTHAEPAPTPDRPAPRARGADRSGVWTLASRYRSRSSDCDRSARVSDTTYTATITADHDATVRLEGGDTVQTLRGTNDAGGLRASNAIRLTILGAPTETTTSLDLHRMTPDGQSGGGVMTMRIVATKGARSVDCLLTFDVDARRR